MPETPTQTESGNAQQAPGELLKQARERLGLAQADIAAQLNLQAEVIDAVEKNDKDRLPIATYFRGYIRSYARLVKLDGDMLIRLYEQGSTPPPEIIPNIKKPTQASSRDKPMRAITYLITFILALLLLAWLHSRYIVEKNSDGGAPATMDSGEKTGQHTLPDTHKQEAGSATTDSDRGQTQTYQEPDRGQSQTYQEPVSPSYPDSAATATKNVVVEPVTADHPVINATLPAAINPARTAETLMQRKDRLEFIVSHDSWIEVYDANKTRMYHGLALAGQHLELAGTAPFSVSLGYSPGVTVRFNDKSFNPAPYSNYGLARFTLGATDNQE